MEAGLSSKIGTVGGYVPLPKGDISITYSYVIN